MSSNYGIDIDEYSDCLVAIGKGLLPLCGDLYAAIEDEISLAELNNLLLEGERKIELYEDLLAKTTKAKHAEVIKKFSEYIEQIRNFSKQLRDIYPV